MDQSYEDECIARSDLEREQNMSPWERLNFSKQLDIGQDFLKDQKENILDHLVDTEDGGEFLLGNAIKKLWLKFRNERMER